jgi:hypothetical protein
MMGARICIAAGLALLTAMPAVAVEDTDTPGARRWEINFGVAGERSTGKWELAVPEADVNYGIGERGQLVLGVERLQLRERGSASRSGLGRGSAGLKWRVLEQEDSGVALALFPSYSWNLSSSAERDGLVEPGATLELPLILGFRHGDTGWFAQAGPNISEHGIEEWQAGFKITRQCAPTLECRVELDRSIAPRQFGHTAVGVGFKWTVAEGLILQASAGRDIRPIDETQHQVALRFGIQLLR